MQHQLGRTEPEILLLLRRQWHNSLLHSRLKRERTRAEGIYKILLVCRLSKKEIAISPSSVRDVTSVLTTLDRVTRAREGGIFRIFAPNKFVYPLDFQITHVGIPRMCV